MEEPDLLPQILTPCSSGRRSIGVSNSPEFEFWMAKNSCHDFPQLSADELFSDGVLLPLHLLHISCQTPAPDPVPSGSVLPESEPEEAPGPELSANTNNSLTSSKRWRDIFKKSDKKINGEDHGFREMKKREKKNGGGGGVSTAAELNINIWPFSRSRSGGAARPRSAAAAPPRKVSSAPCSRSNSAGESKSRKWPSSPGRAAGVHLGRSSPVWQVRRGGGRRSTEAVVKKEGNEDRRKIPFPGAGGGGSNSKARVLSSNIVPMCIGYRQNLNCGSEENGGGGVAAGNSGEGARGGNLFNIKSLFTKRVY